jgi:hypothetical protein
LKIIYLAAYLFEYLFVVLLMSMDIERTIQAPTRPNGAASPRLEILHAAIET